LVDYGATVLIGSPIIEFTEHYCLDANTDIASEHLDWICLGATLAQLAGFALPNFHAAADLETQVSLSDRNEQLKQLIRSCLQNPTKSNIAIALSEL
jgi:hypothetical protein